MRDSADLGQQEAASASSRPSPPMAHPSSLRISGTSALPPQHHTFVPPQPVANVYFAAQPSSSSVHQQEPVRIYYQQQAAQPGAFVGHGSGQTTQMGGLAPHIHLGAQQSQINRNKKLQVDDALVYLEKVRLQFAQSPEVYNEFLEVMKQFKSHVIDTYGVIVRVSQLFRVHPNLIDGFNTFLPLGYEVRVQGNMIHIKDPGGGVKQINNANQPIIMGSSQSAEQPSPSSHVPAIIASPPFPPRPHQQATGFRSPSAALDSTLQQSDQTETEPISLVAANISSPPRQQTAEQQPLSSVSIEMEVISEAEGEGEEQLTTHAIEQHPQEQQQQESQQSSAQQSVPVSTTESAQIQYQPPQQQPIHVDQALGFLNKIKERFLDQPEVYREFLDILRHYQRTEGGQKLSETEVYQAVAKLFKNEADLMRDFKSFMPDACPEESQSSSADTPKAQQIIQEANQQKQSGATNCNASAAQAQSDEGARGTMAAESTKPVQTSVKKRTTGNGAGEQQTVPAKKAKAVTKISYDTNMTEILEEIPLKEFAFFVKIHNALQSEKIFNNFLRVLMLYNKSIVSKNELIELATPFLASHPDLLKQLKDILGGRLAIARQPRKQQLLMEKMPEEQAKQIDFTNCKKLGVSYRCLPDSQSLPLCSGRTELCKSVLNDRWVCVPTWFSEDTSVVSKKKSLYEETMCRTEEERFEVDNLMEVNKSAIIALEFVRRKMESKGVEEAAPFMAENMTKEQLGCSPTVLSRAVKKLYGEHATRIMDALRTNPLVAVPQVLKRMRDKDEEWRATREEYVLIWRDQVDKNYFKSLDHQASAFKINDLKNIRSKSIQQQLENIFRERQEQVEEGIEPEWGPHLCVEYQTEAQLFRDANELILHHVKKMTNRTEKRLIRQLLLYLIPRLFMLQLDDGPEEEGEHSPKKRDDMEGNVRNGEEDEANSQKETEIVEADKAQPSRPKRGRPKQADVTKTANGNGGPFGAETNPFSSFSFKQSRHLSAVSKILKYVFFYGSEHWLHFIRLHALLFERLIMIKSCTEELVQEYVVEMQFQKRQREDFERSGDSLENDLLNAIDVHRGLRELKKPQQNPENFYQIMLQEMKNLLDKTVDIQNFEDTLRSMFGVKAYILFTMDKLVETITRHLQRFVSDNVSMEAFELFQEYYAKRVNGPEDEDSAKELDQQYELAAEKLFSNQKCYKMCFINIASPIVTVELIDTQEPDTDEDEEEEDKESSNVKPLHKWAELLKDCGVNYRRGLFSESQQERLKRFKINALSLHRNMRYRKLLVENLKNAKFDENTEEREFDEEDLAANKQKIPHLFISKGFCNSINDKDPLEIMQDDFYSQLSNILVRKGALGIGRKSLRRTAAMRRKRWTAWLEKHQGGQELSARWFTTGCSSIICQHSRFKFLKFTKYASRPQL